MKEVKTTLKAQPKWKKDFQDELNKGLIESILNPKELGIEEGSGDWVTDYEEPDYSREFGMACWCEDKEQCQNEEH